MNLKFYQQKSLKFTPKCRKVNLQMYYYRVKEIYYKLKLDKNIAIHVEEKSKDIEGYIQQMAKVFSLFLFFTIYNKSSCLQDLNGYTDRYTSCYFSMFVYIKTNLFDIILMLIH